MEFEALNESEKQSRLFDYQQSLKAAVDEELVEVNTADPPGFVLTIKLMRELCEKQGQSPIATLAWVSRSVEYIFEMIKHESSVSSGLEKNIQKLRSLKNHDLCLHLFEKTINLTRIVLSQAKYIQYQLGHIKSTVLKKLGELNDEVPNIWTHVFGFGSALMIDPQKIDPDHRIRETTSDCSFLTGIDELFEYDPDWMQSKDRECFQVLVATKERCLSGESAFAVFDSPNDDYYRRHIHLFAGSTPPQPDMQMHSPEAIRTPEEKSHQSIGDAFIQEEESPQIPHNPDSLNNLLAGLDREPPTGEEAVADRSVHGADEQMEPPADGRAEEQEPPRADEAATPNDRDSEEQVSSLCENETVQAEEEPIVPRKVLPQFYMRSGPDCAESQVDMDGLPLSDRHELMVSLIFDQIDLNFRVKIVPTLKLRIEQLRAALEGHIGRPNTIKEQMICCLMDPWTTAAEDWSDRKARGLLVRGAASLGVLALCYCLILELVAPVVGPSPVLVIRYVDRQDNILVAALARYLLSHLTWSGIRFLVGENPVSSALLQSRFSLSMLKRTIHYLLLTDVFRWMFSGMSLSLFILQTWMLELLVVPDQLVWQVVAHMRAVVPADLR